MNTRELRIGNLLRVKSSNEVIKEFYETVEVLGIGLTFITIQRWVNGVSQEFEHLIQEDFTPIMLTDEILLKCGFEVRPFSLGIVDERFRFIWKEEYKYWYVVDRHSQCYLNKIEFVHEFQNFMFLMNGTEINVLSK